MTAAIRAFFVLIAVSAVAVVAFLIVASAV
jgi:hypothetical protein